MRTSSLTNLLSWQGRAMRRSVVSVAKLVVISRMSGFVEISAKERKEVVVPVAGVEPATFGLQNRCSTN